MTGTSRRRFLQYGVAAGAALGVAAVRPGAAAAGTAQLGGRAPSLRPFVEPLPVPGAGIVVASPVAPGQYHFTLRQIRRRLHPQLPKTPVWAYDDGSGLGGQAGSFGMAIAAQTGTPIQVSYTHGLPATYPSWIPVDTRLTPLGKQVRMMAHLHGGFVAAADDGNPTVSPDGFGPGETQTVVYPNEAPQQSARLMWFHDHAMGATRLNVFAGLAGGYILRDEHDTGTEPNPIGIPGGQYEIPLVIQDRQFNPDGTFLYPVSTIPGVTWIGEYFGNYMLVNGKVWPYLNVEPRLYRFRILNGCNARIMSLDMGGRPDMADRRRGRHVGPPGTDEPAGAHPGRASRRDRRLPRLGGADAHRAQHDARAAGIDACPAAADGHADPGRYVGDAPRAARHPARPARSGGADCGGRTPPSTSPSTRSCPRRRAGG